MQVNSKKLKKLIIKAIPYVAFSYVGNLIGYAYRTAEGNGFQEKLMPFMSNLGTAFAKIFPSLHPYDLLFGLIVAGIMRLVIYVKSKNRKKFRQGEEYGSAVWGTAKDIEPYMDSSCPENNVILTQTEYLTMGKPSAPKYARNKNCLIIGGSGSGKTRFFVKPNLMQMHSSYVVTDPKGTVLVECGKMLERGRPMRDESGKVMYTTDKNGKKQPICQPYKIKVFNTIDFAKSTGEAEVEGEDADDANDKKSIAEVESLEEECDFCVYDDIRDKLIAKGIPAAEIAYIHDAKTEQQKADLFDKVRSGEIRVLLGSTAKMGTGTNVQKKLIAVHDLDIPWRPADLEQRAGRIIRQGNENKNVQIFRYVTKGTFDAYSYQTLENKQRFISQIMTSKTPARKCEDVDQQALTYSEIKALCTGDERIKEKLMLENDVKELRVLAAEHRNTVFEMEDRIGRFPEQEQRLTTILDNLHTDREALRKLPIDPERKLPVFKITIGETEYADRKEAAKALEEAVLAIKYADTPVKVGSFQGFELSVTINSNLMGGGTKACLRGAASHTTKLIESFAHNLNRLESALYNIDGRIERTQSDLAKLRLDHEEAQKIVAEPFPQQEELDSKEERLKVLTDELNQAAIEAKKNAPKREKTCYFERAKMKREAMRIAKKPKKGKAQGQDKKQGIE